ncbi:hypothetical protein [Galbibacter sp.]|uniref:hypothetical protein n=1 Tax=Galbibacter sp. TaxID=2918471 RepID=UPI003A8DCBD3
MMQLIYYLSYYFIEGIFSANILGIHGAELGSDFEMFGITQEAVCQTFTTFMNHNLLFG